MNKFKDTQGGWLTKALFWEISQDEGKSRALFTLKDEDHQGCKSLYKLYMESEDITEYEFANAHLGGWKHWQAVLGCPQVRLQVERWRHELELKLKARALRQIMEKADMGDYQASKYMVEKGWEPKEATSGKNKRGRPTKAEILQAASDIAYDDKRIQQDLERLKANDKVN